jgi:hypothetical protein
VKAQYQASRGEDPRPALTESLASYRRALELDPNNLNIHIYQGIALIDRGRYLAGHGRDPNNDYEQALASYRRALAITTNFPSVHSTIALVYWLKGQYLFEHGQDPQTLLEQALVNCHKSIAINPKHAAGYSTMAATHWLRALYLLAHGENPLRSLAEVETLSARAIEINPDEAINYINIGGAQYAQAKYLVREGKSIDEIYQRGITTLERARTMNKLFNLPYQFEAKLHLLRAESELARRRAPDQALARARDTLTKALELKPDEAENYRLMGELYRWQAEARLRKEEGARADINALVAEGVKMVERAIAIKSDLAEAEMTRAALLLAGARATTDAGMRAQAIAAARASVEKALAANKNLARDYRTLIEATNKLSG